MPSGLDPDRTQQEGGQVSAAAMVGGGWLGRRTTGPRLVEAGDRRRRAVASRGRFASAAAGAVPALLGRRGAFVRAGVLGLLAHPGNGLADQLLDRRDALMVGG